MSVRHSLDIKRRIISLRKEGKSIKEIMDFLSLSKTTVWHYIKTCQCLKHKKQKYYHNVVVAL